MAKFEFSYHIDLYSPRQCVKICDVSVEKDALTPLLFSATSQQNHTYAARK